jgi:flavin reductase (DIM6/NTAB) family NADH-FMN oxidoreductase RutF
LALKQWLRESILGLTFPQEYLCVGLEKFQHPLSAFLTSRSTTDFVPVQSDMVLGYRPLIMAFPYEQNSKESAWLRNQETICLTLVNGTFRSEETWRGFPSDKFAVARVLLKNIHVRDLDDQTVVVFEGMYGEHQFLNSWHQFTNRLRERFRLSRPDNYLEGNLYDQVRIGYGVPRVISIITVDCGEGKLNMFPTDLHGPVGRKGYVGSLRHGGKANDQVERFGTIALSNVHSGWCKEAYALGKNHILEPRAAAEFPISRLRSETFGIPLPAAVTHYRELRQLDSFDVGIHRIHFYETVHEVQVDAADDTLAHIHLFYAQWRKNRGMQYEYLIR